MAAEQCKANALLLAAKRLLMHTGSIWDVVHVNAIE
jgi:hypothetical protein